MKRLPTVELRRYAEDDFTILRRNNAPEMTAYLGGPETEEKLLNRHQRYLDIPNSGKGHMFVVWLDEARVGMIGYWEHEDKGEIVWETGWGVLPEFQGRGIAVAAIHELVKKACAEGTHRFLHAYPRTDNAASNALCRNAGFELVGEMDFEYPAGNPIRCNDWQMDLQAQSVT